MFNKAPKLQLLKLNLTLLVIFVLIFTPITYALELEITDNGGNSDSEIQVSTETNHEVTQDNNADVSNDISENAETGSNEASGNTNGDVEITTGDISTESDIDNDLNYSSSELECCASNNEIVISGNGEGSVNTVKTNINSETIVTINQTAKVSNSIEGNANSGENKANNNTDSDTSIYTGDIKVANSIESNINSAYTKVPKGGLNLSIKILENGEDSNNVVNYEINNSQEIHINNLEDIESFIIWDANTGNNEASGNTGGDVSIITGDIDIITFIRNFGNIGGVEIECCEVYDPGDPGDPSDRGDPGNGDEGQGGNPTGGSSNGSSSSDSSSDAGGSGGGSVLGLSDTSSDSFQVVLFWFGLLLITFGGNIIANELPPYIHGQEKESK